MTSQRERAEQSRLDPKFQAFLEGAPDAIVVVDATGRIVAINALAEEMFGYSRAELIGRAVELLVPERFQASHTRDRAVYSQHPRTRPMGTGRPLVGRTKEGKEFAVEISLSPLETDEGTLVMSIVRDITDRRKAEEQLQASLREKEVLLKEIHHRVKNNLQITSSLLRLQAGVIEDPRAREIFAETQDRIRSMALVHEKLYQSTNLARIDFSDYIGSLADLLLKSFAVDPEKIAFEVSGDKLLLAIDTAVPCALIVNELLSNALKHAFPGGRGGHIGVDLRQVNSSCQMIIRDDGVGFSQDLETSKTLGLQLIRGLVQQIEGTIVIEREGGTSFTITFPAERAMHA